MSLFDWIIASTSEEVGISAFDFYSFGHICMGIGIFLVISLFYTIPMSNDSTSRVIFPLWLIWIFTIVCGIIWEYVENTYFITWGIKFEGRHDSVINMVFDVVLVAIGGLGTWFLAHIVYSKFKKHWIYYTWGILCFMLCLGLFIFGRYLTLI